jgi:hypothetical protein
MCKYGRVTRRYFFVCSLVLSTFALAQSGAPRERNGVLTATDRYQKTLDLLFPQERPDFRKVSYQIFLRFEPSFSPESQIVMTRQKDGTTDVFLYSLPDERSSVADHINELVMQGIEDPLEISKRLRVDHRLVSVQRDVVERIVREYADLRISPLLDTRITLDPTTYELRYESVSNQLRVTLAGPDYSHAANADPVVRWMSETRLAVVGNRK